MDGIAIGCSPTLNALLVYNPWTKLTMNPSHTVSTPIGYPLWLNPSFDMTVVSSVTFYKTRILPWKRPILLERGSNAWTQTPILLLAGTVMDIPLSSDTSGSPLYQILFDNSTAALFPLAEMSSLIPPSLVFDHASLLQSLGPGLLRPFLVVGSCIRYKHEGTYHKGYLTTTLAGTYCFSFKTHVEKKSKDWGVDLPNLPFTWVDLCTEGILIPGHIAYSFI
jgi:hypothetical protein